MMSDTILVSQSGLSPFLDFCPPLLGLNWCASALFTPGAEVEQFIWSGKRGQKGGAEWIAIINEKIKNMNFITI